MIEVNGKIHSPIAYTTYFDECGKWSDFIKCGYKMFFVNVSFTDLPINNTTGFTPFRTGVFETDVPDFSEFDEMVKQIIGECPDALIFPRINISMPRKWINDNLSETVETPSGNRESLCSDKFMLDGSELLKTLVIHIRSSDYAEKIAGYQLCGGTTQEWIHHDLYGSFSETGIRKFREWMLEKYGVSDIEIKNKSDFEKEENFEIYSKYCEFCNETTPKTVEYFAKALKEFIDYEQIVGVFYGYSGFVSDPLWGLHGLSSIVSSPYIDFFSSPCCYDDKRNLGLDWGDMIPVDSVKLHGKLCFIECDIRTHLTKRMQESRPGLYSDRFYNTFDDEGNRTVWCGPESLSLSVSAIRKVFAHQLTKASGVWWFDMWGGWYDDKKIMAELNKMQYVAESSSMKDINGLPSAETVLFIDEKGYSNIDRHNIIRDSTNQIRVAMGNTGVPFDTYMVEDAEKVIHKYKFVIFTAPVPSRCGKSAVELCEKMNIPYLSSTKEKYYYSTEELRKILVSHGIHCYNTENNVVYSANGFLGIHNRNEGEIKITLPKKYKIKNLFDEDKKTYESDEIILNARKFGTEIFEISCKEI